MIFPVLNWFLFYASTWRPSATTRLLAWGKTLPVETKVSRDTQWHKQCGACLPDGAKWVWYRKATANQDRAIARQRDWAEEVSEEGVLKKYFHRTWREEGFADTGFSQFLPLITRTYTLNRRFNPHLQSVWVPPHAIARKSNAVAANACYFR